MTEINYYVDPDGGNDLNDGLTPQTAFRRVTKMFGPPLDQGESHPDKSPLPWTVTRPVNILLKRGSECQEIPSINRSGPTSIEKISIGAYGTGPAPRIWGIKAQSGAGVSNVRIEDLFFKPSVDYANEGIGWRAVGRNNTIRKCRFEKLTMAWAIEPPDGSPGGHIKNFVIEDCRVQDTKTVGTGHSQGGYQQGFEDLIIRRCHFNRVGKVNNQYDHGLYLNGNSISATIEECIVSTDGSVGIQCRGGRYNVINNLVMKCAFGITFGSGTNKKECGGKFLNNTVLYGRDLGSDPISCGIGLAMIEDGTEVANNIVAYKRGSSAPSNFGGISYGNPEATEYTSLINPTSPTKRKSGNPSVHDNFVIDWSPSLVLSERSDGGFTGNYYLVKDNEVLLKIVNSRQWSTDALNRQFVLPEQVAEMCAINTWWSPTAKWLIRMEGWDHQPILIDRSKSGLLDPGSSQDQFTFDRMPDVTIETYLLEHIGLPIGEATYDRFMEEALKDKDDGASWATAAAYNRWARSRVGL